MRITLPTNETFSVDRVVRSHGWYDLPPFSYDREAGVLETAVGAGGNAVAIRFEGAGGTLQASARGLSKRALAAVATRVFSLDLDLSGVPPSLSADPLLARAFDRGAGRMLRAPSIFEDAVKLLLTTNCSWAATRGMVVRTIALAGAEGRAFPTPSELARFPASRLERDVRCGYRAPFLACFARRVASGRLDLDRWEDHGRPAAEIRDEILKERGFGPYAAEGLLRILGRHDFLAIDSWVRQRYRQLHPGPAKKTDASIARRYARFGEHRGLALWLELTGQWHEEDGAATWP